MTSDGPTLVVLTEGVIFGVLATVYVVGAMAPETRRVMSDAVMVACGVYLALCPLFIVFAAPGEPTRYAAARAALVAACLFFERRNRVREVST